MSADLRVCVLLAVLAFGPVTGIAADGVAGVLDAEITLTDLESAGDEPAQLARFRDWIWERVFADYIVEQGLVATPGDIAELLAYHREFERKDRLQRARKLEELNERLAGDGLEASERTWLEEFRGTLARMAERDAESERAPPPDVGEEAEFYGPLIEFWKGNRALYQHYGGTVSMTAIGPAAHGARVALVADYERSGLVQFLEPGLREQFYELMSRPPDVTVPPERVDFTPYWQLPIPPSYFPD